MYSIVLYVLVWYTIVYTGQSATTDHLSPLLVRYSEV